MYSILKIINNMGNSFLRLLSLCSDPALILYLRPTHLVHRYRPT